MFYGKKEELELRMSLCLAICYLPSCKFIKKKFSSVLFHIDVVHKLFDTRNVYNSQTIVS